MPKRLWMGVLAAALACAAPALRADVWDQGTDSDNDSGTDNELVHGLDQVHDLGALQGGTVEDVDWYRLDAGCNTSHEVVLDGFTGQVVVNNDSTAPALEGLGSDATTVIAASTFVSGFGSARRVSRTCVVSGPPQTFTSYVRVSQPACGTSCTGDDRYRIRYHDITALLPRFNNANGQVTVLVLQNSTDEPVGGHLVAYDSSGTTIPNSTVSFVLEPYQVSVFNLSTVQGGLLNNKSGGLRILNNAPYGALAGKAVALEPATGFTFDTPIVYKPH